MNDGKSYLEEVMVADFIFTIWIVLAAFGVIYLWGKDDKRG